MSPQYVDINADGHKDLITGCFEGNVYVIAGLDDGKFAEPEVMKDVDDKLIRLGQYWNDEERKWSKIEGPLSGQLAICTHAVDWDGDGDLDLLSGSNSGYFFLRENIGSIEKPKYASVATQIHVGATIKESRALSETSDQESDEGDADDSEEVSEERASTPDPLRTSGHAMPFVADWDGDGKFDIFTGASAGGVFWARNVGTKFEPKFEQMTELIAKGIKSEDDVAVGSRSQVSVVDFNNDGKLDVVVGDYNRSVPKLTEEQQKIRAEYLETAREASRISLELRKIAAEKKAAAEEAEDADDENADQKESASDDDADEIEQKEAALRKELKEVIAKVSEIREKMPSTSSQRHGYVWLFEQE